MIINLTQHEATPEQISNGVLDVPETLKADLVSALTFTTLPNAKEIAERAEIVSSIALRARAALCTRFIDMRIRHVMIGGAPFFMSALERSLQSVGLTPLYAFSKRESVEETQPDGSVVKKNVFKHEGFVEVL